MNYQKIYDQIIERAKNRVLEGYKEKHHIQPKCLGGLNVKENLVSLTAKEHFICHKLLCLIYPENSSLQHAMFLMSIGKQKFKENHYKISGRIYERLKKEYSEFLTGKKHSKKTCIKKSEAMLKVWENKSKEEKSLIGQKIRQSRIKNGTVNLTQETKIKISNSLKGRKITWDRGVNLKVEQYDLEGNFIREWISIAEARRGVQGDVQACLSGKQKTAGGYLWKFKENKK